MGMAAPIYHTADMVRALPDDGNRYETVHGDLLVTPAPRMWHQIVVDRLHEMRVPTYWVVEPDEHFVEVWTPDVALPRVERERVEWLPAGAAEPLVLSVAELFRPL